VVVILIGVAGSRQTVIGQALAGELGWRFEDAGIRSEGADADQWVAELHRIVARATDRREPLVMSCAALEPPLRDILRGDLRQVRFVQLAAGTAQEPSDTVAIDGTRPIDAVVADIRRAFGL
jgi:gluconate kinase